MFFYVILHRILKIKKMKKLFLATLFAVLGLFSCSKSENGGQEILQAEGEYIVKVLKSEGVTLDSFVVVYDGQTFSESIQKPLTEDFVRSYKVEGSYIAVSAGAKGSNENSTLTLQLIKGGKVIKTSTSKGEYLATSVND